jgi:squalene synthase HpnC
MNSETDKIYNSFKYCEKIAKDHYENFPVGSLLVPADKRKYVWAIYAFARYADDIADSGELSPEIKLEKLILLEEGLLTFINNSRDEVFEEEWKFLPAVSETLDALSIPVVELTDLLKAFKQDAVQQRYDSFEELIEYSRYSANPIGHLVLYVFGYNPSNDEKLFAYSDNICTALQLTNFWQDVSVDLEIGRVYLPQDVMTEYNYSYDDLLAKKEDERFTGIMRKLTERTRRIFTAGQPLIRELRGRLKLEIKATYMGGNAILDKIEAMDYGVLSKRVKLGKRDKASLILKTFLSKAK